MKDLTIVSNGKTYKNINKSARIKKLEKKLRREQRCLSRKYENLKKGESTQKNIQKQKFYEFRTKLKAKCDENGIELRVVDRWYPSSKICHCCGAIKKDLKLSDRIYRCDCGYVEDRDFNAALNLRNALTYEVAQ